ncbi:redoxin domain-containing protein [Patescibacteria group bacterium]|nr:redoxin domain-containing protein [Patescibacteria group bacterium]
MNLILVGTSFLAGLLTILAPCVLPLLPVIIGSTAGSQNKWKPVIVTTSLALSIVIFTLILKASSLLIDVPQMFWTSLSGGVVLFFGLILFLPEIWEKIVAKIHFGNYSQVQLAKAGSGESNTSAILVGAALGPVFSSCSPTYFVILATILPVSFFYGLIYLLIYALGVAIMLGLIGFFGQRLISNLGWAANPRGWFRRIMGILLIIVGVLVVTGYEKKIETAILDAGFGTTNIEEKLLESAIDDMGIEKEIKETIEEINKEINSLPKLFVAPEFVGLENWINTEAIASMEDLKGKVVLIDFWTYSCINCIRTLPYIQSWHELYADQGLVIIGVHAPEFQFEQKFENVQKAVDDFGLSYAVVQDNDFKLWRSYNNHYWPAKYLIDKDGIVRYTHFGEGEYTETESAIVELLNTEMRKTYVKSTEVDYKKIGTRETYIGLSRQENYVESYESLEKNQWSLGGDWQLQKESAISESPNASVRMNFTASKANLVISGTGVAEVLIDGKLAHSNNSGKDVVNGQVTLDGERLYELTDFGDSYETHEVEIIFEEEGVEIFAWTFG